LSHPWFRSPCWSSCSYLQSHMFPNNASPPMSVPPTLFSTGSRFLCVCFFELFRFLLNFSGGDCVFSALRICECFDVMSDGASAVSISRRPLPAELMVFFTSATCGCICLFRPTLSSPPRRRVCSFSSASLRFPVSRTRDEEIPRVFYSVLRLFRLSCGSEAGLCSPLDVLSVTQRYSKPLY